MSLEYKLTIDKNSNFEVSLDFFNDDNTPMNLSDYNAIFIVRERNSIESKIVLIADEVAIKENQILIKISASTSKKIILNTSYYNLILEANKSKYRVLEGQIIFTGSLDDS